VWPHDNSIAAMGLARYANTAGGLRILETPLGASIDLDSGSLPELFCGCPREEGLGPVPDPVVRYPQAWSAVSVFLILRATLGLKVMGFQRHALLDSPAMPPWLEWLRIDDLKLGDDTISLIVRRAAGGAVVIEILENRRSISVQIR
jgi:glycogen debranching enzyme